MSYLQSPRLTFSGQFQADPSTVNNDPTHYDTANFKPEYQTYQTATDMNGWWNPDGTGNWRFIGCKVTSVTYADGTSTSDPAVDPIIGMAVLDTDLRTAAKLVDLDPEQQMVSEIWGLVVRIVNDKGVNLLRGEFEVAPFINIWFGRSVDLSADSGAGAVYQSVLTNLQWHIEKANSRYLNELHATLQVANSKSLSIQFNVDRYDSDTTSPTFTLGRMTGSIGPAFPGEPKEFVLGRQLFPAPQQSSVNYATAILDTSIRSAVVDLGNAFQFSTGGVVNESRNLHLAVAMADGSFQDLGKIEYQSPDWYMGTSGVCTFRLTDAQMSAAQANPLAIVQAVTIPKDAFSTEVTTTYAAVFVESVDYVRADKFVFRLNPGETCNVDFYATTLGKPASGVQIQVQDDTASLLGGPSVTPPIGFPPLNYFGGLPDQQAVLTTDANGRATLSFAVTDPGNPRGYIDGQVYGLSYNLSTQSFLKDCNNANFLSLLVFQGEPSPGFVPTWDNFIQPIMQQYANLYPLMSKGIFNLADKSVFDGNAQILQLVFSKKRKDPNYMPATRDLSAYKRKVILDYLQAIIDQSQA